MRRRRERGAGGGCCGGQRHPRRRRAGAGRRLPRLRGAVRGGAVRIPRPLQTARRGEGRWRWSLVPVALPLPLASARGPARSTARLRVSLARSRGWGGVGWAAAVRSVPSPSARPHGWYPAAEGALMPRAVRSASVCAAFRSGGWRILRVWTRSPFGEEKRKPLKVCAMRRGAVRSWAELGCAACRRGDGQHGAALRWGGTDGVGVRRGLSGRCCRSFWAGDSPGSFPTGVIYTRCGAVVPAAPIPRTAAVCPYGSLVSRNSPAENEISPLSCGWSMSL